MSNHPPAWAEHEAAASRLGLSLFIVPAAKRGGRFRWRVCDFAPEGSTFESELHWLGEGRGTSNLVAFLDGCRAGMVLRRRMARKER